MAVQMELSKILITETQDYQLIELREVGGARKFPIVIGLYEAAAIERRLKNVPVKRPQTHELLANTINALGGALARIEINDLAFIARSERIAGRCSPVDVVGDEVRAIITPQAPQ